MAIKEVQQILRVVPDFLHLPFDRIWSTYDKQADVLYLNFKRPSYADDSEITDNDIIIRYEKGHMIGMTILHASKRFSKKRFSAN